MCLLAHLESQVRQLDRGMRNDVRVNGKRPREAYSQMMSSLPKRFKSTDEQAQIITLLPAYEEVPCQLTRHRTPSCIPVPDPRSIPEELQTTLRGREAPDGDPNQHERFLLYSSQEGS